MGGHYNMLTRAELVKKLRDIIVQQTNKHGYLDITEETVTNVLTDLEGLIYIQYKEENINEQLELIGD